jgi:hypothetical protein
VKGGFSANGVGRVFWNQFLLNLVTRKIWLNSVFLFKVVVKMEEIGSVNITLIRDRGLKKVRINCIKGNHVFGFLRPV